MNRKDFIKQFTLAVSAFYSFSLQGTVHEKTHLDMLTIDNPDTKNICKTCGTRYNKQTFDKTTCRICSDERQYVKKYGQQWLSYNDLSREHTLQIKQWSSNLFQFQVLPKLAIAQRAFLIKIPGGNILWDCLPFLDQSTVAFIQKNGGIDAIAISHPHYYSLMNEWAKTFDCPIYIHKNDKEWAMDDKQQIVFWEGDKKELNQDVTIFHIGGHFPGSAVLQCKLPKYKETLFVGDTLYLSPDKKHLSAMFSYPNIIPLTQHGTLNVFNRASKISFNTLFGAFANQNLEKNAKEVFENAYKTYKNLY